LQIRVVNRERQVRRIALVDVFKFDARHGDSQLK
jgi:hypothetical protein